MSEQEANHNTQRNLNDKKLTTREFFISIFVFVYLCLKSFVLFFVPKKLLFKDVRGCNVLITGAGSGLGQGLSRRFANLGATVVGLDLNIEGLQRTNKLIESDGGKFHFYECDVSVPENVYEIANRVKSEIGFISILVSNAGVVTGIFEIDKI